MRKLIIIVLLLSGLGYAQEGYFSTGVDVRNITFGSDSTKDEAEFNLNFKVAAVGQGVEGGLGYELFKRINYDRMYLFAGYQVRVLDRLKVIPTLEPSLINRWGSWGGALRHNSPSGHLTVGLSSPVRFRITDDLSVEWNPNLLLRTDINYKFGTENWEGAKVFGVPAVLSNFISAVITF